MNTLYIHNSREVDAKKIGYNQKVLDTATFAIFSFPPVFMSPALNNISGVQIFCVLSMCWGV